MVGKNEMDDFEALKHHVISIFPLHPLVSVVPESDQHNEINLLKETLGTQRFFFVVDLQHFRMTQAHGIQRWLGYPEKEFTLKQYWSIVHPSKQKPLMAVALQLYETLCTGKYSLRFLVQRYASLVALRHYNGHYLLVKKTSSVFGYDAANRLTAYLNEFTIVGDYDGQPLSPIFFRSNGEPEGKNAEEILAAVMQRFLKLKVFSPKEFQTARMLVNKPGIKQAEIAHHLAIAPHTVGTYCKRFLYKSREFFHQDFSSAAEAAKYLHKDGLL